MGSLEVSEKLLDPYIHIWFTVKLEILLSSLRRMFLQSY